MIHTGISVTKKKWGTLAVMLVWALGLQAQSRNGVMSQPATLRMCVDYALTHQPALQQAVIDEQVNAQVIKTKVADWYPQVGLNYNIQHYLQRPTVTNPLLLRNSSTTSATLTQNIFNSDALLASKSASDNRLNARQNRQLVEIDLVVAVTKSFYDVLISRQQIDILTQDIVRLQKSVRDTRLQYEAGTVDKNDYKRAAIALNNAESAKYRSEELLKSKIVLLKQQMGYHDTTTLRLVYDDSALQQQALEPPADLFSYNARVEFQQLQTQRRLLQFNLRYTKWAWLPNVSVFGTYNLVGQNQTFSKIYNDGYPNSLIGLTLSLPLWQSGKRTYNTRVAQLRIARLQWDVDGLELAIDAEYAAAIANYRGNVNAYQVARENLTLAKEVYTAVQLQYQTGVKTYLDVIVAETDLRSAEVNWLDALYLVLSSKVDVQKSTGTITY